jgi:hypothetical protein
MPPAVSLDLAEKIARDPGIYPQYRAQRTIGEWRPSSASLPD